MAKRSWAALVVGVLLLGALGLTRRRDTGQETEHPPASSQGLPSPHGAPALPRAGRSGDAPSVPARQAVFGVVLEDGAPAPGAEVWVGEEATLTGPDGRFHLEVLQGEEDTAVLARRGARASNAVRLQGLQLQGEGLVLGLRPGVAVTGTVQDAADGAPVAGARVRAGAATAVTGAQGAFTLPVLPGGAARLRLEAEGFHPWEGPLQLSPGRPVELRLALARAQALSGHVLGPDGAAVPGAQVEVRAVQAGDEGPQQLETDRDGAFHLPAAPAGPLRLQARAPGARSAPLLLAEAAAGVALRLSPAARVEGVVRDTTGAPVPGAQVRLRPVVDLDFSTSSEVLGETGPDGTFALEGPPGALTVRASAGARGTETRAPLRVREGETAQVTLELPALSGRVQGRVLAAATGLPVAGAQVAEELASRRQARARTDAEGRFTLEGLAATGRLVLSAAAEGHGRARATVDAGTADAVQLVLPPAREVHGQVLAPDGTPAPHFWVEGEPVHAVDGRFRHLLAPEAEQLRVRDVQGRQATVALVPGPADGGALDVGVVRLAEPPRAELEVWVVDAQGRPVPGAQVRGEGMGEGTDAAPAGRDTADAEGRAVVGVAPGPVCARASAPGSVETAAEGCPLTLSEGTRGTQRVVLRAGGWVEGVVRLGGRPVPSAEVSCTGAGAHTAITDARGRFRLGPVREGECRAHALVQPDGGGVTFLQRTVAVRAGETVQLVLEEEGHAALTGSVSTQQPRTVLVMVLPGHVQGPTDGEAWAEARLQVVDATGGTTPFRLDGLPEGPLTLLYGPADGKTPRRRFLSPAPGEVPFLALDVDAPLADGEVR